MKDRDRKICSNSCDELLELEQEYHNVSGNGKRQTRALIAIIVVLSIMIAGLLVGCSFSKGPEEGLIMDNVSIAGINVGGMTAEEAVSALRLSIVDSYAQNAMVLAIADQKVELSSELTQVSLNAEGAVEAAYALGRTGTRTEKKEAQMLAATTGIDVDITPYLYVNTDAIKAHLDEIQLPSSTEATPTTWEIAGEIPDLTTEEVPAQMHTLLIHKGLPAYSYDVEAMLASVVQAYKENTFIVEVPCEVTNPEPLNFDDIHLQHTVAPVESVMDTTTYEASNHAYGYTFDKENAIISLEQAQYGEDIVISFTPVSPAQTKGALDSLLFRDVLSKHKATAASKANRNNNLKLACKAIDGTVIMPGEVFDYNQTTGKRTTEKGYLPADGYAGGKTVKMVGGGVCQPSSVIYYCALLADMEIVQRSCHQFISSYMDPGMDATVSWGGPNFRFRNNTDYPIRIDASASGGSVTISIVGTDTKDYYVKMEYDVLSKTSWETKYIEMEADNEDGYKDGDVITTPYKGYTVKTYRCRYSKADDSLIERVYETKSVYDKRDKEIAKILPDETEATQKPSTSTEPTSKPSIDPSTESTQKPSEAPPSVEDNDNPPDTNNPPDDSSGE